MARMPGPRPVVIVAVDRVQSLDVTGPLEVFARVGRYLESVGSADPGYAVSVATPGGRPVRSTSGLLLGGDAALEDVGAIDTLIVAGGEGARASLQPGVVAWLRDRPRPRRLASVCTGAYLLAAAGLLDGRRATTHWASCEHLAQRHPEIEVLSHPIYVRDGDVWTSAGVTAGMDLALAMVEEDLGRDAALTIARWLVLFLRRPGNQAQFSTQLAAQLAERDALRDLQAWMAEHPDTDLSVPALADRAAMSPRNFARRFAAEVGVTPARYVERVRLEAARRRLEETDEPIELVAAACGFGTPETLRRAFLRTLEVAPTEYRRRFRTPAVPIP